MAKMVLVVSTSLRVAFSANLWYNSKTQEKDVTGL